MPDSKRKRFLNTRELTELDPTTFSKSRLDYWARQDPPIGPPFVQPGGPRGIRIYDLDAVENVFSASIKVSTSEPTGLTKLKQPPVSNKRGKVGIGLASFTPKKPGPKKSTGGQS